MSVPLFKGVITALATPFCDGALDVEAFAALVERQIAAGVHGVVPVGTTGEGAVLSHEEHQRVVSLCVEVVAGRVPVHRRRRLQLHRRRRSSWSATRKRAGADAALVVTPYYNRPSQEGLYRHFEAINDAVDLPVVVYNVPSRTSVDIADDTLARLSALPNIVGVKDATGDLGRASLQRLSLRRAGP